MTFGIIQKTKTYQNLLTKMALIRPFNQDPISRDPYSDKKKLDHRPKIIIQKLSKLFVVWMDCTCIVPLFK